MSTDSKDPDNSKKKDDIKKELNDLLKGYKSTPTSSVPSTAPLADSQTIADALGQPAPIDFDQYDKKFKAKATGVIQSMFKFYLDFGVIDLPEYLERKREMDTMNVSNIFLQLKMTKTVLASLIREISTGNTHPRIYEAYSQINSQFSEVIRSQANYILFLEESYKKARFERNEMSGDVNSPKLTEGQVHKQIADESDYYITSDDKSLIKEISETSAISIDEVMTERSESIRDLAGSTRLTDPHAKDELMVEKKIDASVIGNVASDYESILDMI